MICAAFYHLFADGQWQIPAAEYFDAMEQSGLAAEVGVVRVGIVGDRAARVEAASWCHSRLPVQIIAVADTGAEEVTLKAIKADPIGDAVWYCHGKGSANPSDLQDAWRREMVAGVISDWRHCAELLETHEAVGQFWLRPEDWPGLVHIPFFGGNVWAARASLIARLPAPRTDGRGWAEAWIGLGDPDIVDLAKSPGLWPGYVNFR